MELVLPMYNAHPYFSRTNLGKRCALHTAKYGILLSVIVSRFIYVVTNGSIDQSASLSPS